MGMARLEVWTCFFSSSLCKMQLFFEKNPFTAKLVLGAEKSSCLEWLFCEFLFSPRSIADDDEKKFHLFMLKKCDFLVTTAWK